MAGSHPALSSLGSWGDISRHRTCPWASVRSGISPTGGCGGPGTGIFLSHRQKTSFPPSHPSHSATGPRRAAVACHREVTARRRSLSGRASSRSSPRNGSHASEAKVLSQTASHPAAGARLRSCFLYEVSCCQREFYKSNGEKGERGSARRAHAGAEQRRRVSTGFFFGGGGTSGDRPPLGHG